MFIQLYRIFSRIYIYSLIESCKPKKNPEKPNKQIKKSKKKSEKKKDYFPNGESNPGLAGKLSNFNQPESGRC